MPISRKTTLLVLPLLAAVLLSAALSAKAVKTTQPQAGDKHESTLKWTPVRTNVSSEKSRLLLELPDLGPGADWIVGVQPAAAGEGETMAAGLVSWEDSSRDPAFAGEPMNVKLISRVTDYPADRIEVVPGRVSLASRGRSDAGSDSLMVYLKVAAGTRVIVRGGGREFVKGPADEGLIVHSGAAERAPVKGVHSLVGRLLRSRMLGGSPGRGK
ncbi:MAG: hypothetical protein M3348_03660 [Acidobacteriota bacterium]|nr:hypothetical protein [Acidobacteriota bacterium]